MKTLLLFLAACTIACAADEVTLQFPQLDLLDGRKLKNVVVKSYDAKSGDVLVVTDDKAMVIPITQIPPPFFDRVKADAPAAGSTTAVVAAPPPPPVSTPLIPTPSPAPAVGDPEQPVKEKGKGKTKAATNLLAQHKAVAEERAKHYFQFEIQVGSNSISVNKLSLDVSQPTPVDGWTGRYRTTGKAYYEFYDSLGSFQRGTGSFEVLTEQDKPGGEIRVVDFTHG
jgi:hypothetical protein